MQDRKSALEAAERPCGRVCGQLRGFQDSPHKTVHTFSKGLAIALGVTLGGGCTDVFENAVSWGYVSETDDSGTATTAEGSTGGTDETSGSDSSATTTGSSDPTVTSSDETTGAPETIGDEVGELPPQLRSLTVNDSLTPELITKPGPAWVRAEVLDDDATPPVVTFFDNDEPIAVVDAPPYEVEFPLTGADYVNGEHSFRAEVREAQTDEDPADAAGPVTLAVDLPDGGELWWEAHLTNPIGDSEAQSVALGPDGTLYTTGYAAVQGGGTALWVGAFESGTGELLWKQTVQKQEKDRAIGHGVALDGAGNLVVTGTFEHLEQDFDFGPPVLYIARFSTDGALDWETSTSDHAYDKRAGRAITVGVEGELWVAGYLYLHDQNHDAMLLRIDPKDGGVTLKHHFDGGDNRLDEAHGVAIADDGDPVFVGTLRDSDDRLRAFARKVSADDGGFIWGYESPANSMGEQDEALSIAALPDGSFVIAGWRREEPSGSPRRLAFDLDADGQPGAFDFDSTNDYGPEAMRGVAANASGRFALVGVESHPVGHREIWVRYQVERQSWAWFRPDGQIVWNGKIAKEPNSVSVGTYGAVAIGGYRTLDGNPDGRELFVQIFYP